MCLCVCVSMCVRINACKCAFLHVGMFFGVCVCVSMSVMLRLCQYKSMHVRKNVKECRASRHLRDDEMY